MSQSTDTQTGWAKQVLDLYEEGGSDAEVAASLRVPMKQFYKRMADSAAFANLVEFGRTLSLAYWEGTARKNIGNKSFNSPLFAFYMKNRHGWADKTEVTSSNENTNVNLDDMRKQVNSLILEHVAANTPEMTDAKRVLSSVAKVANE